MDMEKLYKGIEQLGEAFTELQKTQEKSKTDTDTLVQTKLAALAEDVGSKVQAIQDAQMKLQAVIERTAAEEEIKAKGETPEAKAFKAYLRGDADAAELKALSTDDNPNGGYLVPVENLGLVTSRIFETSPIRNLAQVRKTANKSVTIDMDDQKATGRWEGEGSSSGETATPALGKLEITAKKMEAEPAASLEDLQDSAYDMESWLYDKVAEEFGRMENTAFVTGDGVLRPRGFLTYPAGAQGADYSRGSIEQVVNGSTSAATENGLIDLVCSLKEGYQPNAVFGMHRTTFANIMKLAGSTTFRFLNLQPMGPAGQTGGLIKPVMTLMDKPLYLMADMPTIATNSLSVVFGDFRKGYLVLDRVGVSVLRDPYTAKGKVKFYTTKRTGGAVQNFEALKLLKMSAS